MFFDYILCSGGYNPAFDQPYDNYGLPPPPMGGRPQYGRPPRGMGAPMLRGLSKF